MCSSNPVDNPARFTSQALFGWNGIDAVAKKVGGKSISDVVAPKDKVKQPKVPILKPYRGLAIGTQTGGTRQPLGK